MTDAEKRRTTLRQLWHVRDAFRAARDEAKDSTYGLYACADHARDEIPQEDEATRVEDLIRAVCDLLLLAEQRIVGFTALVSKGGGDE
jgi:hypothetical protein